MSGELKIRSGEATSLASDLYTHYAKYVIETRALPSTYDGLKAVQRRLLWVMSQMPDKLSKSAKVVGETIKYHPHGDASIYGTLLGMGNPMNHLHFLKTKGNFGGAGTGAAAMRYTECKLGELGRKVFTQLIEYSDFVEGETGEKEPSYIPTLLPYSLIDGSHGIGVGLSQTMFALNSLELANYYLGVLKNEEVTIPRPELGEMVLDHTREEVEEVIRRGKGRLKAQGVVHRTSENSFSITNLPPDVKLKHVLKKVQKWIDDDKLDFANDSGKTREYNFTIVSNKLKPEDVQKTLQRAVTRAKGYNFIFSENENAIYCGLDYVVMQSLGYLRKCVVRKFNSKLKKSSKQFSTLSAIEALKESGRIKDLPSMSKQEVIDLVVGFGFHEAIAKDLLTKSISYLTKDHGAELEEIQVKIEKYKGYIESPDSYLIPLYEELVEILAEQYKDKKITIFASEKIGDPHALVNERGNVQITKDKGVNWASKLYLVDETGMTYPKAIMSTTETELEFPEINVPFVGLGTDKDKYLVYIIENPDKPKAKHKLLAVDLDKLKHRRNFVKLAEGNRVVGAFSCPELTATLETQDGSSVEINVKGILKSRYASPNGSDHRFKIPSFD